MPKDNDKHKNTDDTNKNTSKDDTDDKDDLDEKDLGDRSGSVCDRCRDDGREIEPDEAFAHAALAVRQAAASGVDDFEDWGHAQVEREPLTIEDLNGRPLFHDFAVEGRGVVRASANSLVGSPVVALQLGAHSWSPKEAMARAERAAGEQLGRRVSARSLVCYAYPKIGVRVEDVEGGSRARSAIVDVGDLTVVEDFGSDQPEGQTAYSFLDEAARTATSRLSRWQSAERELEAWRELAPEVLAGELVDVDKIRSAIAEKAYGIFVPLYSWNTVRYAPRCARPEVFQLYAQQTNVYCAVATGQMILDFYKYHFDQTAIASAMNTGSSGTSNPDQVTGYESLSNDGLDATYDTTASWSEAKAEIDANRPVKSGIPGHARAVAGWKRQNILLAGSSPKQWLKVFDPWPWNSDICDGGAVYWEDWDAVTHTNWIYVRHS